MMLDRVSVSNQEHLMVVSGEVIKIIIICLLKTVKILLALMQLIEGTEDDSINDKQRV